MSKISRGTFHILFGHKGQHHRTDHVLNWVAILVAIIAVSGILLGYGG
jgi:hypothetical protein